MDLHQIEIFCTLIRLRSFSRTAEALYLSQPTVSGHIKNLETELGVRLVDRLGKRIVPTDAGGVLFRHGLLLLEQRDQVRQELANITGTVSGALSIGASTIPGAYILPRIIGTFKKKHPAITIQLLIEDTAKITTAVMNGGICMGIVGATITDPLLETHSFMTDELVVAVPPRHALARKKSIPLSSLAKEPFILREEGSGTRRIMTEKLSLAGLSLNALKTAAVVGSSDAVRQSVKAGLGISILSRRALLDDISDGRIAALRITGVKMERTFSVILLKGRSKTPLCRTFLEFMLRSK